MSRKSSITNAAQYFLAVVVGFAVDFLVFSALTRAGVAIVYANSSAFLIGTTINVWLLRAFVFKDSRFRFFTDLAASIACNGATLVFGTLLIWVLVTRFAADPYWSKLAASGITFCVNYWTRVLLFRKRQAHVL